MCMKLYFRIGETASETYSVLDPTFGEKTTNRVQTFQLFLKFRSDMTSVEDENIF